MSDEVPPDSPFHSSPTSSLSLAWAPPRSPLPPHRLAKLANALGVSTPIPAHPSPSHLATTSASSYTDHFRRSPTPSTVSNSSFSPYPQSTSKFLLHVIPPECLPHDSDSSGASDLTPPPPHASGYHAQFRRGTLVPMHPTLQSQLGAIAKEYALPSTVGMILYLIQTTRTNPAQTPNSYSDNIDTDEPGPRLSEDIWKHLWNRVLLAEREEGARTNISGLGFSVASQSSPLSPPEFIDRQGSRDLFSMRPLVTPQPRQYPFTPSPSTPSSVSDIRSQSKSAPPSSSSISQSEPPTPDTSSVSHQADHLDLPGLRSPAAFVPILAKVEFDIDRRKAGWFEPWLRSRKVNHAKRARSLPSKTSAKSKKSGEESSDPEKPKNPLLDLRLVGRMQSASPTLSFTVSVSRDPDHGSDSERQALGYGMLTDSPECIDSESGDEHTEEPTTEVVVETGKDPLDDVFGSDADTWADIHASSERRESKKDSKIVDLALNAEDLTALSEDSSTDDAGMDEDEVEDLLEALSSTAAAVKKHVPPPLVIQPHAADVIVASGGSSMPPSTSNSAMLPYLTSSDGHSGGSLLSVPDPLVIVRSPTNEKRDGGVFDDFDLGLELDDGDLDEGKSQVLMKARLDEIEKTLAQLSPRQLQSDDSPSESHSAGNQLAPPPLLNAAVFPPTPLPSPSALTFDKSAHHDGTSVPEPINFAAWPSVPFSALVGNDPSVLSRRSAGLSVPSARAAGKDVSPASSSHSLSVQYSPSPGLETETEYRKRELAEQQALYPPLRTPGLSQSPTVIPLSPDPFSRYPSSISNEGNTIPSTTYRNSNSTRLFDTPAANISPHQRTSVQNVLHEQTSQADASSSRFSADSIIGEDTINVNTNTKSNSRSTRMSVKSIKNLWRKGSKSSVSLPRHPDRASLPPAVPPTVPLPAPPLHPAPHHASGPPEQPAVAATVAKSNPQSTAQMQHRVESSMDHLHFNQESPYPVRRSPAPSVSSLSQNSHMPPVPETMGKDKSIRKSILKSWKSSPGISQSPSLNSDPRSSIDRYSPQGPASASSSISSKSRRPSLMIFNASRGSLSSPAPDVIPPSPKIPQQYISPRPNGTGEHRQSVRSKVSMESEHSRTQPVRSHSVASSRASGDTRVSIDVSQFEIVSPKITPNLAFPYHGPDHE